MIILLVFVLLFAIVFGVVTHKCRVAGTGFISSSQLTRWWGRQPPVRDHRPAVARRDFRAVSIKCGAGCCQAAKRLEGKRGFPGQIPRLPLSQCKAEKCACTYVQHKDRRTSENRRDEIVGLGRSFRFGDERRQRIDRRSGVPEEDMEMFNFEKH